MWVAGKVDGVPAYPLDSAVEAVTMRADVSALAATGTGSGAGTAPEMEKALSALKKRVAAGQLRDRGKIERRLGAIQARPIFHQKEHRTKAPAMVAFPGYALWVTLKHLRKGSGSKLSTMQALALASTLHSADICCPPPMAARSACAVSPWPHASNRPSSIGCTSTSPIGSISIHLLLASPKL